MYQIFQTKSYIDQKLAVKGKGSNYRYQTASVICASQNGSIVSAARGRQKNISSYKVSLESKKIEQTGTYYVQASLNMDGQQYQNGVNSYGFGIYGPENGFKLQEVSLSQIPRQVQSSLQQCRHVENLPSYVI
ncbi:hypothetical protein PPERSA_00288 [Pseudocohnilembus persalinus]|uniref:Uncharacterized protein n=1 Tax=Pseudocohnilembus persalinus TaxID=266149 RepID=A0A0V0Q8Y6_PSEPJ|nr:hypothetical protein PPERSA_00288 [Pseudocohnilembus persalinus]|eukprot:KRW98700.1 hypothetical protein PPERSA_00288 [Pseudocohnilembus persalinus]